uniref:Phytanoyl-CoA hydroxylase-interacting protein-like C-terminal domain-containing protein n=1 Tax=Caenorhabditis japonica TaxID=281687 RepID=A0A8R1DR32_CAEJA
MYYGDGWGRAEQESWRPYARNQPPGPMRGPSTSRAPNGWDSWIANPYFTRNAHAQTHMRNFERNRMHMFNTNSDAPAFRQRQKVHHHRPEPVMNEYARQILMDNAHVPGLRTGLQMRSMMQQNKLSREMMKKEPVNVKVNVKNLHVGVAVFSEKIELRWEELGAKKDVTYTVISEHLKTRNKSTTICSPPSCEIGVVAGETYKISLECHNSATKTLLANWSREIRAEFSYTELKRLFHKCYSFITRDGTSEPQMHEFFVVYRCKPKVYWDEIHHYGNDVMQKYIKDDNGQPGNLINGKINGLFFSARLLPDLTLPPCSPFGNVRMIISASILLNPECHNFYFADFYCNKNIHYVTVVICFVDSETDRYCRERLIKLNPLSNPFFKLVPPVERFGKCRFYINYSLWVELYYTEDIQLDIGQFSAIMATGAGTSRIGGLPNNKQCTLCNLYPTVRSKSLEVKSTSSEPTTTSIVLRGAESQDSDPDVVDTLLHLIDRVEEDELSTEKLTDKLDADLMTFVEMMNKTVSKAKTQSLSRIANNLNDFVASINKRRDALIEEINRLKDAE